MRRGGRPTIPPAPYEETPQYDVTPQQMPGAPVVPEEYTMNRLGYEAAPMPPDMPATAPPMAPQLLSPHEQELLNQPQSEYDFMLDEIERAKAGLPLERGQMTAVQPPLPATAAPMVSEAPAPTIAPEEQWMLDEQSKIAEIRRRASVFSPEYAEYGMPPKQVPISGRARYTTSTRPALEKQFAQQGWHRFHGIKPPEYFAGQRARKRERQLAGGAAPTWPERAEHEMALAELGQTYPPAERITTPKPRTRENVLDELTTLEKMAEKYAPFIGDDGKEYPGDPAQYAIYNDLTRAKQGELAAMEGGEVSPEEMETAPFVDRQWPLSNIPAVTEPVRRFKKVGQQRKLTPKIAAGFLQRANGDRELAQRMAAEEGYIE